MEWDNTDMSTTIKDTGVSPQAWDELQAAIDRFSRGIRDAHAALASRERMDHLREENRKRMGLQEIAVDLIRECRDNR